MCPFYAPTMCPFCALIFIYKSNVKNYVNHGYAQSRYRRPLQA